MATDPGLINFQCVYLDFASGLRSSEIFTLFEQNMAILDFNTRKIKIKTASKMEGAVFLKKPPLPF